MTLRTDNMHELDQEIEQWTRSRTKAELFEITQRHQLITAPVQDLSDVISDPHLHARGTLQAAAHPELGDIVLCSTPLRFAEQAPPPLQSVNELGADTDSVLAEFLQISDDELQELADSEVI